jgi:hypothetical protein
MLNSKRIASSLDFSKHYATKARSKTAKRSSKQEPKQRQPRLKVNDDIRETGELPIGDESNWTKTQREQAELASYSRKIALAAASLQRTLDKAKLVESTKQRGSVSDSVLVASSTSSQPMKTNTKNKQGSSYGAKKYSKSKTKTLPKKRRSSPSFVVEMDPVVESAIKYELGTEKLPQSREPDPIKVQSPTAFRIGRKFELVARPAPNASDMSHFKSPKDEETVQAKTDENGASSPQSLRMAALEAELASMSGKSTKKNTGKKKAPSARIKRLKLQKSRAASLKRLLRAVPISTWPVLMEAREQLSSAVPHLLHVLKMRQQGKHMFPVRPPYESDMLKKELAEEDKLLESQSLRPGALPRSIFATRLAAEIPPWLLERVSSRFLERRTNDLIILILLLAVLIYEASLAYYEWKYTQDTDGVRQMLWTELEADGGWFRSQTRLRTETQLIEKNRTLTWRQIEYGWLPDSVWRWWMRAKDANQDPLIYTVVTLIQRTKAYFHSIKASFFINNSRFWANHANTAHADLVLLQSLKANQQLHPRLRTLSVHSIQSIVDNDRASKRLIEDDAIVWLLRSSIESSNFSSHSLEVLLLKDLLKTRKRVDAFWKMPESKVIANLESLLLHTDENPFFVSIALAALVQHAPPTHPEYIYKLVSSTLGALSDPSRHGLDAVVKVAKFASLHWLSLKHHLSDETQKHQLAQAKSEYQEIRRRTKYVTVEELKKEAPWSWMAIASPIMAGYIWMRYQSNALWNGLGSLPIRVRKLVTMRRAIPASLASLSLVSLFHLRSRYSATIADFMAGTNEVIEPQGLKPKDSPIFTSNQLQTGPSPSRRAFVSFFLGSALLPLQISIAFFFPFTLLPTYVFPDLTLRPISWWRKRCHVYFPKLVKDSQ